MASSKYNGNVPLYTNPPKMIEPDWSVDILLRKSLYHIANSARGQDEVNPVFWLATWAGMMGLPSPALDSPYWPHARKLTKFVTFGQCRHIHRKKINDPLGFIVLQTQLAFTIGSRNKQAILDSYQSEIFFYTMNPLMMKPREYKLSWPSLFGQDDWMLASFFFYLFTDRDFVSVHKNAKKKKKNSPNIQPFWPHAWSITLMNMFYADPYKSGKERQYKKCTYEPGICLTYRSVDFLFLVIWFMKC